MMTQAELETYLMSFADVSLAFPFGDKLRAYSVGVTETDKGKLFAIIEDGSRPLRVSLRCDPQLGKVLRERYETVLTGKQLNKKHWITVVCSGQLPDDEIEDLARLSHQLASQQ